MSACRLRPRSRLDTTRLADILDDPMRRPAGFDSSPAPETLLDSSSIGDEPDVGKPSSPMKCLDHEENAFILRYRVTSTAMGADHELPPSFRMTKVPEPR
jgi:hypothetical protein